MVKRLAGDGILICLLLIFSWWLMVKSFGYDTGTSQFRIARHEVGDFGLHVSLIRSFAWGINPVPESPFFPGKPLVYHYVVDWAVGQLVRVGLRIDYALNGVSAIALTILLYGLYRMAGIPAIILFLLPSNLSFIEIFNRAPKGVSFFSYLWHFPDYLHKGPFDGSIITIYTTLAPYLNQRHLIVGSAIAIAVIWMILKWVNERKRIPSLTWLFVGVGIGVLTRVHIMIAGATAIVVAMLLFGKRSKVLLLVIGAAFLVSLPHIREIVSLRSDAAIGLAWNPGYLSPKPLSLLSWLSFWIQNAGVFLLLIPIAYRQASWSGRRVMLAAGLLFAVANTVQVSYRMGHNHSLINFATTITIPFVAHLFVSWWRRPSLLWRCAAITAFFLWTASGVANLMVIKNDYQLMVDDAPKNRLMEWIRTGTPAGSVVMSEPELYDPVTLSGRKNYLGHEYYVSVMGYDYEGRRQEVERWFSSSAEQAVTLMREAGIRYLVMPKHADGYFLADPERFGAFVPTAYEDEDVVVYVIIS